MSAPPVTVKLTATMELKDKQLEVRYQLRNESRDDLYVFNTFYQTKSSGERVLDPTKAYVLFEGTDTIHVTRSLIPIPTGKKVEFAEVPYLTLLGPGKTLEETVLVPVPVREVQPYVGPLAPGAGKERQFKQVYFSIGVLPKNADLAVRELPHVGPGIYAVQYGDAVKWQQVVKARPVALAVPAVTAP